MDELNEVICKMFKISKSDITNELTMEDIPGWDSLSHMNLIAEFESQYDFELTGDEIADMQSIGLLREIIGRYIKASN